MKNEVLLLAVVNLVAVGLLTVGAISFGVGRAESAAYSPYKEGLATTNPERREAISSAAAGGGQAEEGPQAPRPPEALFTSAGCFACHKQGAVYYPNLVASRPKPVDQLAHWIRNAPSVKPGIAMPSYAAVLSEEEALGLAQWIKDGHPKE